ncbi:MAG: ion transporter, partial [Planctomycetota bacterium]
PLRQQVNEALGYEDDGHHRSPDAPADAFYWFELVSVLVFTIEYLLRLWACTALPEFPGMIRGRVKKALEPLMLVDIVAIAPFYLQLVMPAADLRFVRALRLFRIFRIFRSGRLAASFTLLMDVLKSKREELAVSAVVVIIMVVLSASVIYLAEHDNDAQIANRKFQSIPDAMWWSVVTVTTIGYGDQAPVTTVGKIIGSFIAVLGVCVFALPVGIIGAAFVEEMNRRARLRADEANATVASMGEALHTTHAACPHCGKPIGAPHSFSGPHVQV